MNERVENGIEYDEQGLAKCNCGMPKSGYIPGLGCVREHTRDCATRKNPIRKSQMTDIEFNIARGMTAEQAEHYVSESKRTGLYCPNKTPLLHDDASCACFHWHATMEG